MVDEHLPNPLFNQLIKRAKMPMDLLAGDGKEAMGPSYVLTRDDMIRAVQAMMGKCLRTLKIVITLNCR